MRKQKEFSGAVSQQKRDQACRRQQIRPEPAFAYSLWMLHLPAMQTSDNVRSPGRVPKWTKGTDCKSVIRRFESDLGLVLDVPADVRPMRFPSLAVR